MTQDTNTASGAADSDDALMARELYESQDDSLLLCASDLQHSAIYDNHAEMQSCMRAVAERITALASAPAQPASSDAYEGAREDLSIWKRRALEAERDLRAEKAAAARLVAELNAKNGPTRMGEPATPLAYGETEYGWTDYRRLEDGDKRLMALIVSLYGNDHQSSSDLEGLLGRAFRATPAQPVAEPAKADSVLEDAARLDWLLLRISGAEFRRLGVHYSGNARRADVDAARKQGEKQ